MAIVVALLFKTFVIEISKIPSGSMQPTLMGNPETAIYDRLLVDKLSFHYRDPRRFEIVVFKHPLERSRVMVKRLVGMPGEDLKIAGGDLWTRSGPSDEWSVLRRPEAVQEEMWRRLDLQDPDRSSWSTVSGGEGWRLRGRDVTARGGRQDPLPHRGRRDPRRLPGRVSGLDRRRGVRAQPRVGPQPGGRPARHRNRASPGGDRAAHTSS